MKRMLERRPSASMAVAFLALLAALSGTAVALPGKNRVDSGDIKNRTIVAKDIKKSTIKSLRGRRGPQGAEGPRGATGASGAPGAPGSAKAYATVDDDDVAFLNGAVKGFTAVARPAGDPTGVYCLTPAPGVDVTDATPIGSPEWNNSNGFDLFVEPLSEPFDCPAGTLEVRTYQLGGDATPDLSNDVAFSVLLP